MTVTVIITQQTGYIIQTSVGAYFINSVTH